MTWVTGSRLPLFSSLLLVAVACNRQPAPAPAAAMTFNGASGDLKATAVIPTLDSPIPVGCNAIWCGSFLAAWKSLETNLGGGPIELDDKTGVARLLNDASDPRPEISTNSLYAAAGRVKQGVAEQIQKAVKERFPDKTPPTFSGLPPDAIVAYAYLEASVRFSVPYFQNDHPLSFTNTNGKTTAVDSFGIREKDDYAYYNLRNQARVLFRSGGFFAPEPPQNPSRTNFEFAIDLCANSSPDQIVIAQIDREPTLAAALARVEKEIQATERKRKKASDSAEDYERIGPNDVILVPNLFWNISHHFSELEGKLIASGKFKGMPLALARQDTLFRLDRGGAELKSESKLAVAPIPTHFVLDHPFLIYIKKLDAKAPFFAMWVDNAELLQKWNGRPN